MLTQEVKFNAERQGGNHIIQSSRLDLVTLKASPTLSIIFLVIWRMFLVLLCGIAFLFMMLVERFFIRGVDNRMRRQAVRLRRMIMWVGGAWIKIGQQMSMRLDMFPGIYCEELSKTLDKVTPFHFKFVLKALSTQIKNNPSLEGDVFDHYVKDSFELVGSGSIGCVYRAKLFNGEDVAIKVRRPKIIRNFSADLKAMDWSLKFFESLTIIRPGTTKHFRKDVRFILLEELNYFVEKRYQEVFSIYYEKKKKLKVRAPRIYAQYTGDEVIVSEFVSGISLKFILAAKDNLTPENQALLERYNVNYKKLAKRILRISFYGFFECPFFHGDPHPANIIVQPNNEIVMIDFGACGVLAEKDRNLMRQLHFFHSREDVAGMVQMVVTLMEPLPPIDINAFTKELETAWWQGFYAIKSKNSEWWERTSMRLWLALLNLVRKYEIPIPANMLAMIRATLLFDTVAARLWPRVNVFKEYQKYFHKVAEETRRKMKRKAIEQAILGPDDRSLMMFKQFMETTELMVYKVQQFLEQPVPRFDNLTDKVFVLIRYLLSYFSSIIILTVMAVFVFFITGSIRGDGVGFLYEEGSKIRNLGLNYFTDASSIFGGHLQFTLFFYGIMIILLTIIFFRKTMFLLRDKDIKTGSRF